LDEANGNNTQASASTVGAPGARFVSPANRNSSGNNIANWIAELAGVDPMNPTQPVPPPPQTGGRAVPRLVRVNGNTSPASAFDTNAPAVPFLRPNEPLPPEPQKSAGGLAEWMAALAGVDPQNPTQAAAPPQAGRLRDFYRDDPAWFLQIRR
jgi:hypothetical protein